MAKIKKTHSRSKIVRLNEHLYFNENYHILQIVEFIGETFMEIVKKDEYDITCQEKRQKYQKS